MGRAVKINITLPEEELKEIDAFVHQEGDTRSGLIQRALRFFMEEREKEERERERRRGMIQAASDIKELREKWGDWNGVAEIRKWRGLR